jgi:hypothetical protein
VRIIQSLKEWDLSPMRKFIAATALAAGMALVSQANAAPLPWKITKTGWTEADEKGFGEFVKKIADSGCTTSVECFTGPGNPYRDTDPPGMWFRADCGKFVYMLRAYYASKNGLPFAFVNSIVGSGSDLRFTANSNGPKTRRDLVDLGNGVPLAESLKGIWGTVWTATYRMDPGVDFSTSQDFYSPKLAPGAIRPGTVIYNITGHVVIVYDVTEDGRILYVDSHPDETVRRSAYGPQFGQSPQKLGGGFKNFRPMKLVGATKMADGTYVGGQVVLAKNDEIEDYGLEQYTGNMPGAVGDGNNARFVYNGVNLSLFEYVRASLSGGKFKLNPVYELTMSLRTLCDEVKERVIQVNMAERSGVSRKAHPGLLPGNTAGSDNAEWEEHASLAADARLRNSANLLFKGMAEIVELWQKHDLRIAYDGAGLKEALQNIYDTESTACPIAYTNSAGQKVDLTLHDVILRLPAISFDPYHCIERRWGASKPEELATCQDDETKSRWYLAEQRLRNQAEASHSERPTLTLTDLDGKAAGSGTDEWPAVHIEALIDNMI